MSYICHPLFLTHGGPRHHHCHPTSPATDTIITTTTTGNLRFAVPNDEIHNQHEKSSNSSPIIFLRLLSIVLIGCISIWANNEADKGFEITIPTDAGSHQDGGHRKFQLLYVSNDKAARLVLKTSQFVEALLYPPPTPSTSLYYSGSNKKKVVNRVTLRLACRNLTQPVIVDSYKEGEFVLHLNPSVMQETNDDGRAVIRAVQRGMARVWIFENHCAPSSLVNGMVEYVSSLAASIPLATVDWDSGDDVTSSSSGSDHICCKDENPVAVARFLSYCEEHREGFIQRLNQAMSGGSWHDGGVDDALGMPAHHLCSAYHTRPRITSSSQIDWIAAQ